MNLALFKDRRVQLALTGLGSVGVIAFFHYGLPLESPIGWVVDIFGFFFMFAVGLVLISQFSLPVSTWDERVDAVNRIFDFAFGNKGPVVFVKDGKLIGTQEELKRRGAGVILVDSSSAVVLEKGLEFSRAVGPGLVYMKPREKIKATLDLRKQSRGREVSALTMDGIEVKTTVKVVFALTAGGAESDRDSAGESEAQPPRRKRPYPFNPRSCFQAVYGGAVGKDSQPLGWTDLPPQVAAERFRNLLARNTLDGLFRPTDPKTFQLMDFGKRLTEDVRSDPVLVEGGIEVFGVSVGAFDLHPDVQKQRVAAWEAEWKKRAEITLIAGEIAADKIKQQARRKAQEEISATLKLSMSDRHDLLTPDAKRQVGFRILEVVRQLMADPETKKYFRGSAPEILSSVRAWMGFEAEEESEPMAEGQRADGSSEASGTEDAEAGEAKR